MKEPGTLGHTSSDPCVMRRDSFQEAGDYQLKVQWPTGYLEGR